MRNLLRRVSLCTALLLAVASSGAAQGRLTTPREQFGHDIGADYVLPNYQQLTAYWQKLAGQSDRMRLVEIGKSAEGRPQWMAVVSSPANLARLDRLRGISEQMARGHGVDSLQARALAREGKAVVWIDGGLHASEVLGAQQLMETLWQLVSRNDPETLHILDEVVVLFVHANPDGMELVSNWYMRNPDPARRSLAALPRLYQKYIGHDNNRDFFASTQPETENMNRVMYRQWYPQIVYNHHQTGPTGTVMFAPPFRDPFNYVVDPLVVDGIDLVGAAMHARFDAEDMPGVTSRRGSNYSTWWNGGLRTTAYFHNMIGLLTETIGSPTPMQVPFVAAQQYPRGDLPNPVAPQRWHFRRSIDYSVTANYAVLDLAARYRETLLQRTWRMASNSIRRGSEDHWTLYPSRLDAVRDSIEARRGAAGNAVMMAGGQFQGAPDSAESQHYLSLLHQPALRDARGYVIPADQPDFPTATKLVEALLETGVEVMRATAPFTLAGRSYPAGSFVLRADQAFRPHLLDMFEPQDHPNDFLYPGGPPIPPYDVSGWTLAYQMGVRFDRVLEGFSGPFVPVTGTVVRPSPQRIAMPRWAPAGYLLSPRQNDAFTAVNRLLAAGVAVSRVETAGEGAGAAPVGSFYVPAAGRGVSDSLDAIVRDLGVSIEPVHASDLPRGLRPLRAPRIALWDRYGGSIPSGWVRWILEQFHFPFQVVYAPELDAGNLNAKYDVIVLVSDAVPERDRPGSGGMPEAASIPAEYRGELGNVSVARTVPQLRAFLENGGRVVTIGGSSVLARHLGLPLHDALVERDSSGAERHLPNEKFYIPGALLRVAVDPSAPSAWGMDEHADVMFDENPVFTQDADAAAHGVRRVAWFDSARPLRSGWAWGQERLNGGVVAAEARVGQGTLFLFAPEITFRAQPHGTFKLLFNSLYASAPER
jgi:hypothetical protein